MSKFIQIEASTTSRTEVVGKLEITTSVPCLVALDDKGTVWEWDDEKQWWSPYPDAREPRPVQERSGPHTHERDP